VVEICAVINAGYFAGRAAEDLGLPGVEMRVEMDDRDGSVSTVDGAEEREGDCVVAT